MIIFELVIVFSEKTDVPQPWIFSFSAVVTLKIRSRSPKSNHFFVMSQLYIHENLVKIQQPIHKILYRQDSVMRRQRDLHQNQYVPLPRWLGT